MKSPLCLMPALLMIATLGGCSESVRRPPLAVSLPAPPDYAQPATVSKPRKGETLIGIAARERAGRIAANGRIIAFREWYESVRKDYGK